MEEDKKKSELDEYLKTMDYRLRNQYNPGAFTRSETWLSRFYRNKTARIAAWITIIAIVIAIIINIYQSLH